MVFHTYIYLGVVRVVDSDTDTIYAEFPTLATDAPGEAMERAEQVRAMLESQYDVHALDSLYQTLLHIQQNPTLNLWMRVYEPILYHSMIEALDRAQLI